VTEPTPISPETWEEFEKIAKERLEAIQSYYREKNWSISSDLVEDLNVDYDEGAVYLTLEGDLVISMLKYLTDTDDKSPSYNKFTVRLDGYSYDKLRNEIGRV